MVYDIDGIWGRVHTKTTMHPWLEVYHAPKLNNRVGQYAMEAIWEKLSNLPNGRSNEGILPIFVYFVECKSCKYNAKWCFYVLFIEYWGWCSLKGVGFVTPTFNRTPCMKI